MEVRDERRLRRAQKHLAALNLLVIDELGYVSFTAMCGNTEQLRTTSGSVWGRSNLINRA